MAGETSDRVSTEERLLTGYSGRIMVLILLGTAAAFTGRFLVGPLLPSIIEDLGITASQAGFALTLMWIATALMQYPGGRMADHLTYKTVLVGGMSFLTVSFALLTVTRSYAVLVGALVVLGMGGGMFSPSTYAQLATLFERRRGQAFGLYTSSVDVGGSLSGLVTLGALAAATWRVAYAPVAVALGAVVVGMHFLHRGSYDFDLSSVDLRVRETVDQLWHDRVVRLVLLGYVLHSLVFQGVLGFLPTFLQTGKGFSSTVGAGAFTGFFLLAAVVRVVSGYLGDRIRYLTVATGAALSAVVGLVVMGLADTLPVVAAGIGLLSVGIAGYIPVVNALLMDRFPDASMGGDYGAARTVFTLLSSGGSTYVGVLAQRANYEVAFLGLVPFMFANTLIVGWLLYRNRPSSARPVAT